MTHLSSVEIWFIIIALGIGTFLIRFSFIGLMGDRPLPDWALRHLRYTAVAVLPALIAPLTLWPAATGGEPDPIRLTAAFAGLAAGYLLKNAVGAMIVGFGVFYLLMAVF